MTCNFRPILKRLCQRERNSRQVSASVADFSAIPYSQRGHFQLHFYASVLRLMAYIERMHAMGGKSLEEFFQRYPFLAHYRKEMGRYLTPGCSAVSAIRAWEAGMSTWEADCPLRLPLVALARLDAVGPRGLAVFLLAGIVEEDSRFGTLLARLQEPLATRRPTLELAGQTLSKEPSDGHSDVWENCCGLLRIGAIEALNPDAPRSEWALRVPGLVWDAARGGMDGFPTIGWRIHPAEAFPFPQDLILPEELCRQILQAPRLLESGRTRLVVLRGSPGSDRLQAAGALARAGDRRVIEIAPPAGRPVGDAGDPSLREERYPQAVGVLCTLLKAVPVFTFDLAPGETALMPNLPGYEWPVIALMGREGGLSGELTKGALTLSLPALGPELRLRCWQAAFMGTAVERLEEIAERFLLPGGTIRQAAALAVARAGLENRTTVRQEDVRLATRALNRQQLDNLADRIDGGGTWEHLIVGGSTLGKLSELEQRCRHRERLLDRLGPAFAGSANRGVRALFSGSSGTGKTLAARILAAELGMDLYRVDLASVINKYIGETEKNLHRVLSRAEEMDIVLLLDEGDALLGSRTEVKSSNDRYANLETNYLLQRLESYNGIILVTTNAAQNIDSAFQRRMDVVVHFVPPTADERWEIWQLHLPEDHAVGVDYLTEISTRCDLTGGQIRNAALLAALLAVEEGSAVVQDRHLEAAVRAEYRKAGAVCPLDSVVDQPVLAPQFDDFQSLLS